jgi:glycosyltransferase involved in cell wall biosynthesis
VFCELYPQADLFTLVYCPDKVSAIIRSMNVKSSWLNRLPGIERAYRYFLPLFPRVIEGFDLRGYDLILSSSHCVAKGVLPHHALHIAYIHAPMRYVWHQYQAYFGAGSAWLPRLGMALCRSYLQTWDTHTAHRVDYFVANSDNIAKKIRRIYGRDAVTLYPPVELERFSIADALGDYYLLVAALVPYKRVEIAIAACNDLGVPLKIVGEGPLRAKLERRSGPRIEFLGRVGDEALTRLYANCRALLFPGEEDFGIVAVEAQACGKAVIAYGKGGLRESVVGLDAWAVANERPTGIFFLEPTAASLKKAMERFEQELGTFDPVMIRKNAEKFSRDRFKGRIAEFVAEKILERSGS